jgi:tetratricopeptide (TPR) repeat protein
VFRLVLLLCALVSPAAADVYVWVDEEGRTFITDDPDGVPEDQRGRGIPEGGPLGRLWGDPGEIPAGPVPPSQSNDRVSRLIRGAIEDLQRGNVSRAAEALDAVLRTEPGNAEAHFYAALLAQQRGRLDSAEAHLRAFLAQAGDALEPWRESAKRRLAAIEDERRLAGPAGRQEPLRLLGFDSENFRVHYDARLGEASPSYARTVARYLEEAHQHMSGRFGAVPAEPTGVVLYGKASYLRAHAHRFSFQTVGFFDGQIHVVSAAHPAGELRALLFHEYAHAVFRERSRGDRPYWLNEGLAELAERSSRRLRPLRRDELVALRTRIQTGAWIPLRRLSPGFAGLSDAEARTAYLEATAAADWLGRHTEPVARARLLERLGAGVSEDTALGEAVGRDTDAVDAAVRAAILAEFPSVPLSEPAGAPPDGLEIRDSG